MWWQICATQETWSLLLTAWTKTRCSEFWSEVFLAILTAICTLTRNSLLVVYAESREGQSEDCAIMVQTCKGLRRNASFHSKALLINRRMLYIWGERTLRTRGTATARLCSEPLGKS